MNRQYVFFVKSSSTNEVYTLKALRQSEVLCSFVCSCVGGQMGALCKHRTNLVYGEVTNLISDRSDDPSTLKSLFSGSFLERSMQELLELEKQHAQLKRRIAAQKKVVAQHMFGRA